jgi:hypothetical protein
VLAPNSRLVEMTHQDQRDTTSRDLQVSILHARRFG